MGKCRWTEAWTDLERSSTISDKWVGPYLRASPLPCITAPGVRGAGWRSPGGWPVVAIGAAWRELEDTELTTALVRHRRAGGAYSRAPRPCGSPPGGSGV